MATQSGPSTKDIGPLLTSEEAAARMRVSVDWLLTRALRGEIQSIKLGSEPGKKGGKRLFPEAVINEWLSRRLQSA